MKDEAERLALVEDGGAVIADVENEPDGEEAEDAIDVGLEKIPDDVAVEQSHEILEFKKLALGHHYCHPDPAVAGEGSLTIFGPFSPGIARDLSLCST